MCNKLAQNGVSYESCSFEIDSSFMVQNLPAYKFYNMKMRIKM